MTPPSSTISPNFVLLVNGIEIHNAKNNLNTVLSWSVNMRFVGVASSFNIVFSADSSKDILVNDRITILLDDTVMMKGIVEDTTEKISSNTETLSVSGYDYSGWMMKSDAVPKNYGDSTDNEIINDIFAQAESIGWPFFENGEANVKLASPFEIKDYTVSIGKSFYDVCSEVAGYNNMYFYITPSGIFYKTALAGNEQGKVSANIEVAGSGGIYTPKVNPTTIMGFSIPSGARISSPYGANHKEIGVSQEVSHAGVDVVFVNDSVVSVYANSGIVKAIGSDAGYGNYVDVNYGRYVIRYAHFLEVKTSVGSRIGRGTYLGIQGSTGISTAPHCDIRVIVDNQGEVEIESLTPVAGGTLGAGISSPSVNIDVESSDFADAELSIHRSIADAKSDVLVFGQVGSSSTGSKESIASLLSLPGTETIEEIMNLKRTGRKTKAIVNVSPNDGQRPDLLNTDNIFRTEGTNLSFNSERPGSSFRRRKIINHTAQSQESALRKAERMFDVTAPKFEINVLFKRLVNFEINSLVHLKFKNVDSDFIVREVNYSQNPSRESTSIRLVLPGRLQ